MKPILVVLIAVLASIVCAEPIWSFCGTSSDTLTLSSITLDPEIPAAGKALKVQIKGQLSTSITGGNAHVLAEYAGVTLFEGDLNLCEFASSALKCPVPTGPFDVTINQEIPPIAPTGGPYTGFIKLTDQTNTNITCIRFKFMMQDGFVAKTAASESARPVNDVAFIKAINSNRKALWKAGHNKRFAGMSVAEVQKIFLGARGIRPVVKNARYESAPIRAVPETFDWRTASKCVHSIRNQEQCGSCWAFAASEALSDRFCIASNGSINVVLSPQYMVSCDGTDYGCQGGYLQNAWNFLANTGIPTDTCVPYTSGGGDSGQCPSTCTDGSPLKLYKAKNVNSFVGEAQIQQEVFTNGPIEIGFMVYRDFLSYTSGVYHHISGSFLGGHAVKIVGWGYDSLQKQKYWIIANSWGTTWGQQGFFWMLRGTNECGCESNAVAGQAAV